LILNMTTERTKCPPWGLLGGKAGLPNGVRVVHPDGSEFVPPNGKMARHQLNAQDVFVIEAGGGGGYGDPHLRARSAVRDDFRRGYISRESAITDYGMKDDELNGN
jgi:N-methylhydantoinase B